MEDLNSSSAERLATEIELLQAMYPEQINWTPRSSEVKFVHDSGATLVFRLPEQYPEVGLPTLISATTIDKQDFRHQMQHAIANLHLSEGEEVLDTIVQCYQDHIATADDASHITNESKATSTAVHSAGDEHTKTVIIWLHHLLATSKRKLALDPTVDSHPKLSGITKPGYPGVLLFSGPSSLVDAHVTELKNQRWQAFQVRFEEEYVVDQAWKFRHGDGIKELESMSDIVQDILDKAKQEAFLKAIGVK